MHILIPLCCPFGGSLRSSQLVPVLSNALTNSLHRTDMHCMLSGTLRIIILFRVTSIATAVFADHTAAVCTSRFKKFSCIPKMVY